MCNFFFSRVFDHPALADAQYFMRLDTDSCFNGRRVRRRACPGAQCPRPLPSRRNRR